MPTYVLIDEETDRIVEVVDTMTSEIGEAAAGETVTYDGRPHRKILTPPGVLVEPEWAHVAYQLDPDDPDLPPTKDPITGNSVFLNRREIENYQARQNERPDRHTEMRFDFGIHR